MRISKRREADRMLHLSAGFSVVSFEGYCRIFSGATSSREMAHNQKKRDAKSLERF